jgi:hypothetical protein
MCRSNGQEGPPSTFVAAKLQRDTQEGRPAQRVTRVSSRSHSPYWGELLQVPCSPLMVVCTNYGRKGISSRFPVYHL